MNPFEDYITKNADEMSEQDWRDLCRYEDIFHLSDYFFERFNAQINWNSLRRNKKITTEFAHKYKKYFGFILYYKKGKLHREDGPAIINLKDTKESWYKDGNLHREDGPAIISKEDCIEVWYFNGIRHRENGPAVIIKDRKEWWVQGKRHRKDGPAIFAHHIEEWWVDGQKHRDDGQPAVIFDNTRGWYKNGELHNTQGPAYVEESGYKEYWINGEEFTYEQFYRKIKEGDYED